ncbi:MAG: hypothetical protein KFF73_09490 [Cyclobacteriaceae bacterium]|nr:hypothetical protein [Cyclobacteriaceae bacterium]
MNKNYRILKSLGGQLILRFMLGTIGMVSCTWDEIPPPEIEIPDTAISFSDNIIPIFEARCATSSCHDGSWRPDLRSNVAYAEVTDGYVNVNSPASSELYTKIDGGSMDQYATDQDRALILQWITEGAEDN